MGSPEGPSAKPATRRPVMAPEVKASLRPLARLSEAA